MRPDRGNEVACCPLEPGSGRSEEHTSELQSRQYLVCRFLLEKKITLPLAARQVIPQKQSLPEWACSHSSSTTLSSEPCLSSSGLGGFPSPFVPANSRLRVYIG